MPKYDLSKVTREQLESVVELVLEGASMDKLTTAAKALNVEQPKEPAKSTGTPWDPVAAHADMYPNSYLTAKDFNPNS